MTSSALYSKFEKLNKCSVVLSKSSVIEAQYHRILTQNNNKMLPILYATLRSYAPYLTLPFAGLIGFIGYNLENYLSDKYTPYSKSIKEQRTDRLLAEDKLQSTENVEKLKYSNVLGTNLSPSLS